MCNSGLRALCMMGLVFLPITGQAETTTAPLFHSSSTESITIVRDPVSGAGLTRQTSVNYHQLFYTMPKERDLIAREKIISGYSEQAEGESAEATVDLFFRKPDNSYPAKPDHTTTVSEASKISFGTDHWAARITGCCDAESILQLFAYGSDKPFLYANGQYAQVIVPNANMNRYVGMVLRSQIPMNELDSAIFGNDQKAIATILYAAPERPLQKLFLYRQKGTTEDDMPYHTDSITLKSDSPKDEVSLTGNPGISTVLTMWSQDALPGQPRPTTVSGFSVTAKFAGISGKPEAVTIPVKADEFGEPQITGRALSAKPE